MHLGTSLAVQWLRIHTSTAGGEGMISGWRSKTHIPCRVVNRHRYRHRHRASQVALVVKNPPAKTGDIRAAGSIPGLERSPEEGNGNPLQNSCLENPMNRGAWRATVYGVAKSRTRLKQLSTHTLISIDISSVLVTEF